MTAGGKTKTRQLHALKNKFQEYEKSEPLMHDQKCLDGAALLLQRAGSSAAMADLVKDAVYRNECWRGQQCINLVAAEAPSSPTARNLLASEIGIRASGGGIGRNNRFFTGMAVIDEVESLCVELLKKAFRCHYADHRLMGGMAGVMAAYTALATPGDCVMTVPIMQGGDSSHRSNGPPGVRGLDVIDLPFHPGTNDIDIDSFRQIATYRKPGVVGIGMTLTLFPVPLEQIKEIINPWGGKVYFDAAHQLGLIAAGLFQDPLREGADLMTGSSGKTFSGPQGGIIVWDDEKLSEAIYRSVFPMLTGSHQINRVAALAVATTEMIEYGRAYMTQVVKNAQRLGMELRKRGLNVLFHERNYTNTHQIVIQSTYLDSAAYEVRLLESANIICNKTPLNWGSSKSGPANQSAIRLGTTEITRLGMKEHHMAWIAEKVVETLQQARRPDLIAQDVVEFMKDFRTLFYCHDAGTH
jgi:glycine hydroxymethyltransferase